MSTQDSEPKWKSVFQNHIGIRCALIQLANSAPLRQFPEKMDMKAKFKKSTVTLSKDGAE